MSFDDRLDLCIDVVKSVAFNYGCEIVNEIVFQPQGPIEGFIGLFFCHAVVIDGHNETRVARL